jgi:flagellar biogenesis protein FliO
MDQAPSITFCPIPPETISDMVPLLIVIGVFLLVGWLFRRWKKGRGPAK